MTCENPNAYEKIIEYIFLSKFQEGVNEIVFAREELSSGGKKLGINIPKNLGDIIYSFRYRHELLPTITSTAPEGYHWIIAGIDKGKYAFRLVKVFPNIIPSKNLILTKIPDSTPEIISTHILGNRRVLGDEQALLTLIRYNKLVDIFLRITAYSLQNHLRTTVKGIGQIEIDEIYTGIDKYGAQYIIPVQAKRGNDKIGIVQIQQDIAFCTEKFPNLCIRPLAAQFTENAIALFELGIQDDQIKIVKESQYKLVKYTEITQKDLSIYQKISSGER